MNNFSEVNSELIAEKKEELLKGNIEEAKNIANDINENEKKIWLMFTNSVMAINYPHIYPSIKACTMTNVYYLMSTTSSSLSTSIDRWTTKMFFLNSNITRTYQSLLSGDARFTVYDDEERDGRNSC